jgi:hypothetical protein
VPQPTAPPHAPDFDPLERLNAKRGETNTKKNILTSNDEGNMFMISEEQDFLKGMYCRFYLQKLRKS